MNIFEVETKNGRVFRVALANKNQELRFKKKVSEGKEKSYETIIRVDNITNGVFDIKQFENNINSLI